VWFISQNVSVQYHKDRAQLASKSSGEQSPVDPTNIQEGGGGGGPLVIGEETR
jgi:hypothetical protein